LAELKQGSFAVLKTPQDVAAFLGVSWKRLRYLLYRMRVSRRYHRFEIKKRRGGVRVILSPISEIKDIQRRLAFALTAYFQAKPSVHGFVPNRSILTNARMHMNSRVLLNIDLKDFFPTIHLGRVIGLFQSKPFECIPPVATVFAQICCFERSLPQGAPTSPLISNLICRRLDTELNRLAQDHGCRYSRYADDITFSTRRIKLPCEIADVNADGVVTIGEALASIIARHQFVIHPEKVRVQPRDQRQVVTGLRVNRFPNVSRQLLSQIRAMFHAWKKFGYDAAEKTFRDKFYRKHRAPYRGAPSFRQILKGKIAYVGMVRGKRSKIFLQFGRDLRALDPQLVEKWDLDTMDERLRKSLCVLECDKNQGTGFLLKGVGLITCFHVLTDETQCYRPVPPFSKYNVTPEIKDKDTDLAVCRSLISDLLELDAAMTLPAIGEEVMVLGFPRYSLGASGISFKTTVIGDRLHFGVKRILVDTPIVVGTSGGPVLNMDGKVVGIAVCGIKDITETIELESGFVPIDVLKNLLLKAASNKAG
jgi:RNA-directed DNA polymerase